MKANVCNKFIVLKFRSQGDLRTAFEVARVNGISAKQIGPDSELQIYIPYDKLGPFQSSDAIIFRFEVRPCKKI